MQPVSATAPEDREATRPTATGGRHSRPHPSARAAGGFAHPQCSVGHASGTSAARTQPVLLGGDTAGEAGCGTGLLSEQHLAYIRAGHTAQVHAVATDPKGGSPAQRASPGRPVSAIPLLQQLLASFVVLMEDWDALSESDTGSMEKCSDPEALLARLVEHGLLTEYQAARIGAGKTFGLVLGNYRVLDRLGAGGMGVVFKAEHLRTAPARWPSRCCRCRRTRTPQLLVRFLDRDAGRRPACTIPTSSRAIDAGTVAGADPDAPVLHYFVMEYVPGAGPGSSRSRQQGPLVRAQGLRPASPGRRRPGGGAQAQPGPSRHQAVQHPGHARGPGQAARLRPGPARSAAG